MSVVVRCRRPFDFPDDAYLDPDDEFRNSAFLPPSVFDDLDIEPYEYVRVSVHGGGEAGRDDARSDGSGSDDAGIVVQAIRFEPPDDGSGADRDHPQAALRTNLTEKLREGLDAGTLLAVEPARRPSRKLTVQRGYDDNRGAGICYVTPSVRDDLGVASSDPIELYNPDDGGRSVLQTAELPEAPPNESVVRVDGHVQETLNVSFGDDVYARPVADHSPPDPSLRERALGWLIDYREVPLRVELGLDRDEYRNVVRMQHDTMQFLGVDPGDEVVLEWNGERLTTQCLLPPDGETVGDESVLVASTDRDPIDVSLYDTVTVRRNMGHTLKQQVSVSTLGILGVVFGVFQAANAATIDDMLVAEFGPFGTIGVLSAVAALASVAVVWLLLFPERQRCSRPSTEVR